jgi:hypothetical protein
VFPCCVSVNFSHQSQQLVGILVWTNNTNCW